jgi:hypothetical protein
MLDEAEAALKVSWGTVAGTNGLVRGEGPLLGWKTALRKARAVFGENPAIHEWLSPADR